MSVPSAQDKAIEEIVSAIGTNVVYFENDEYAHFDPISITAAVAMLLLHGYFEGILDAVRSSGKANATKLARSLGEVYQGHRAPEELPTVGAGEVARYGDVAQSVLQTALVKHGFTLRKAAKLAEQVRRAADTIVATDGDTHD
jgi:hypothetical protein